jgi:hypothetical protein
LPVLTPLASMNLSTRSSNALALLCLSVLLGCSDSSGPGAPYTVSINPASVDLTLRTNSASITVNATVSQKSIPVTNATVTWKSSDETVASVTATGATATITGKGHGTATITASVDGAASDAINVSVTSPDCVPNAGGEIVVTSGTPVTGTLTNADCRRGNSPADIYKLLVTGVSNNISLSATSSAFGPRIALFAVNGVDSLTGNVGAAETATATGLLAPGTYWIAVGGKTPTASGNYALSVTLTPIADALCSAASTISTITPATTPTVINGALQISDCRIVVQGSFADVYKLSVASTANVQMDVASTAFNAQVILVDSNFTFIQGDDNGGGGTNARILRTLTAGTYYVLASSFGVGDQGNYTLTVRTP